MNNREVAHRWANQSGRGNAAKGSSFFYRDRAIWSYGSHFCCGVLLTEGKNAGVYLVSSRSYSVSTSKHMGYVRQAIPSGARVVYVPYPDAALGGGGGYDQKTHADNVTYFLNVADGARALFERARQGSQLVRAAETARHAAEKMREYLALFPDVMKGRPGLKKRYAALLRDLKPGGPLTVAPETTKKVLADNVKRRAAKEERERAAAAAAWAAKAEKIKAWQNGDPEVHVPGLTPAGFVLLRVKEGRVETSQGAQITERTARALWAALVRGADVVGLRLDHYTVSSWDGEVLTVGCHKIPRAELVRLAGLLGLPGELSTAYQPKTGAPCACRPGVERDNCPHCEGTGARVDFAAIRARRAADGGDHAP